MLQDGNTSLQVASRIGNVELYTLLLGAKDKADVEEKDKVFEYIHAT